MADVEIDVTEKLLPFTIFEDDNGSFTFRGTFLYKYLSHVFQFVDETNPKFTRFDKGIRRVFRAFSVIVMWCCFLFKMLNFGYEYEERTKKLTTFKTILLVISTFTWTFRYVLLHTLGIVILAHQPNEAIGLTEKLSSDIENNEDRRRVKVKLQKADITIRRVVAGTLICVVIFPCLNRVVGNLIDGTWEVSSDLIEMFITIYTRFVSLPCLFYIVYTALLQVIMIDEYYECLTQSVLSSDELFAQYVKMHRRIERMARRVHFYLSILIILLIIWGSLTAYSTVGDLKRLSKGLVPKSEKTLIVYETMANFLSFGLEVFLLFTIPWYYLGKVTEMQQNLVSIVYEIRLPENGLETDKPFQQFMDLWSFSKRIEKHQKYEDVGYRAMRLNITTLKIVWLTVLAPVFLYLGTAIMKGEME